MDQKSIPYDRIAEEIFAPIYPQIARDLLEATGIRSGRMADIGCGGGHLGFAIMEQAPFDGLFLDILPEALTAARWEMAELRTARAGQEARP